MVPFRYKSAFRFPLRNVFLGEILAAEDVRDLIPVLKTSYDFAKVVRNLEAMSVLVMIAVSSSFMLILPLDIADDILPF